MNVKLQAGGAVEFHCEGCGRLIIDVARGVAPSPALCSTCQFSPGWFNDPKLRRIFDPEYEPPAQGATKP